MIDDMLMFKYARSALTSQQNAFRNVVKATPLSFNSGKRSVIIKNNKNSTN